MDRERSRINNTTPETSAIALVPDAASISGARDAGMDIAGLDGRKAGMDIAGFDGREAGMDIAGFDGREEGGPAGFISGADHAFPAIKRIMEHPTSILFNLAVFI